MTDRDDEQATPPPDPSWLRPWEREAERPTSTTTFVSPRRKRRSPLSRLADVLPGRGDAPSQPDEPSAREAPSEPPADSGTTTEPAELEQPPAPEAEDEADLDRWFDDLDLDPAPPRDVDHGDEDARLDHSDTPEDDVAEAEDDSDEEPVRDSPGASAEAPPAPPGVDDEPDVDQPATDAVPEATEQVAETPTEAKAEPPAEPAPTDVPEDLDRDETPDDELVDGAAGHPAGDLDEDQQLAVAAFLDDPDDEDDEVDEPSGPDAAAADPTAPAEAPAGVDQEPEQDAPASAEAFEEERTDPDGPAAAATELAVSLDEDVDEPEQAEIATPEPHAQVEVETDERGAEPDETHGVDERVDAEVDDSERDEPALPADPGTIGTVDEEASEQATAPDPDQDPEEFAPAPGASAEATGDVDLAEHEGLPSETEVDEPDDTPIVEAAARTFDEAPVPDPATGTDGESDDDPSEPQPVSDVVPTELDEWDDRVPAPDAPAHEASTEAPADADIAEAETPAPEPGHETDGEPEEEPTERPAVAEEVAPDLDKPDEGAAEPAGPGLGDAAEAVEAGELADPDLSPHAGPEEVATPPEEALAPAPEPEPEPEPDTVLEEEPTDPAAASGTAAAELDELGEPAADRGLDDDEEDEAPDTIDEEPIGAGDEPDDEPDDRLPDVEAPGPDVPADALEDADLAGPDVPGLAPPEPAATSLEEASSSEPDSDDEPEDDPSTALAVPGSTAADPDESDGTAHESLEEALTDTDLNEDVDQDLEDAWAPAEPDASDEALGDAEPAGHDVPGEASPEAAATPIRETPPPAPEPEPHDEPDEEPDASLDASDEATAEPDGAETEHDEADGTQLDEHDDTVAELDEPDDHVPGAEPPGPAATAHEPLGEAPTDTELAEEVDQDLDDAWATAEPDPAAEALVDVDRAEPAVPAEAAPEAAATPIEATPTPASIEATPTPASEPEPEEEVEAPGALDEEPVEADDEPEEEPDGSLGVSDEEATEPGRADAELDEPVETVAELEEQDDRPTEEQASTPVASVEAAPPVASSPPDLEVPEPATATPGPTPTTAPEPTPEPELDEAEHGPWLRDVDEAARDLDDTDRRARRLLAGAALSLFVVAAVFGGVRLAQNRAAEAAREQAAQQQQVTTLAADVLDLADVVGPTATGMEPLAGSLLVTLEEHLLASERSDAELDEARSQAVSELRAAADRLRDALGGPAPVPGALVPAGAADPVLLAHARVRAEATALAGEADVAADQADEWGAAVRSVTAALATHARIASEQPETSDPEELAEAWLAEAEPLQALADVAADAAAVPGLQAWADAHVAFAEQSLAWVERAATLLEDGDLETYNTELEETLGVDDPFGFSAALADATRTALDSPVLDAVATVEARAALVVEQVDALERTAGEQLATADGP